MKRKVRITGLPKMSGGGAPKRTFGDQAPPVDNTVTPGKGFSDNRSTAEIKVNRSLKPTTKENATLEAEKGETVVTSLNKDGLPEFYNILGKRHSQGGTPLNLPEDSFIFSRVNSMKIYNKEILNYFGKSTKGNKGFTPAEISRNFNLNKYRQILADPNSDKSQIETAEMMIQNYTRKLGALALVQESAKGFDSGIPGIAMPYLESMGIDPTEFVGSDSGPDMAQNMAQAMYGGDTFNNGGEYDPWVKTDVKIKQDRDLDGWLTTQNKSGVDNIDGILGLATNIGDSMTAGSSGSLGSTTGKAVKEGEFSSADAIGQVVTGSNTNQGTWGVNTADLFKGDDQYVKGAYAYPLPPAVVKFGGEPGLQRFDKGGTTKMTRNDIKLKKGESVRVDPLSGRYIIVNRKGEVKGYLNLPAREGAGGENDFNTKSKAIESSRPTKSQNIPSNANKHYPDKEGYDESKVEQGDYIMKGNRWYLVKGKKVTPYTGTKLEDLNPKLKGAHGDLRESYGRLDDKIRNSPELQKELIAKYKSSVAEAKAKGILKQSDIDYAAALSPEDIINNYLSSQEQIMIINANKGNIGSGDKKDTWDTGVDSETGLPKQYVAAAKELGLTPKSIGETFAFQNVYNGMQGMYDNPEAVKKYGLSDFAMPKQGLNDESKDIYKEGTISPADGWWGNTTVGQGQVYKPVQKELDMEEVADTEAEVEAPVEGMTLPNPYEYTPYWKQDLRNIGAAGYGLASVRKGNPIMAKGLYNELPATYADFRSGASRINANTAAGLQSLQGYGASAAQTNAGFANMQKNNAANIIALQDQEYKTNLSIANNTSARHEAGRNEYNRYSSALTKQYWDETELANNNFKNEKMANMMNLLNAVNQADTNRGMTQSMNIMRDDWRVDPRTGFTSRKYNPTELDGIPPSPKSTFDIASGYKYDNPDMTWTEAEKFARADKGSATPEMPEGYINPGAAYGYPG